MNPTIDEKVIATAYEDDPMAAAAEYGAEFRRDVEVFLPAEALLEGQRMLLSEMQRLKHLDENRRLKQIVAGQTLDIQAVTAIVAKRW